MRTINELVYEYHNMNNSPRKINIIIIIRKMIIVIDKETTNFHELFVYYIHNLTT